MPVTTVRDVREVGPQTIAIELESPTEFEAEPGQFVLIRAPVDGDVESGYYTLSSPVVDETFQVTAEYDDNGTVGPWLSEREVDDEVEFEGPFGDITYTGEDDVVVMAGGPGIGPAVGIAERAIDTDAMANVIYQAETPAYEDRLQTLNDRGAQIEIISDSTDLANKLQAADSNATIYVFGFAAFVSEAQDALSAADIDPDSAHIESFGPE